MIGLAMLGPACTSADGTVTVNTASCAWSGVGASVSARTMVAARIIGSLLSLGTVAAANGVPSEGGITKVPCRRAASAPAHHRRSRFGGDDRMIERLLLDQLTRE